MSRPSMLDLFNKLICIYLYMWPLVGWAILGRNDTQAGAEIKLEQLSAWFMRHLRWRKETDGDCGSGI